ncbi:O-mycaminosyltylonolide 6-deoxyallosyltransferase [Kibdelosporangium banguiense]|uniref:O-mycaminosyltylonolide 6-deoxyallosyltransferase n=1 Tax=Kibdelosporangium banguiense TaxID=1365924 RepID=A0ABS4TXM6_9PSEU|nr:glycosyltransferase [Kibdelosporangium banguiense]MBP2329155.1 O-mycaminosyltylonolide 6-deoxyallosyltransferase [Kibdelosporangium banguiense]
MHVALVILGTRGDIQPFVALGRTLMSRGHTVTLAAPGDYRDLIAEAGLDHREMPVSPAAYFAHPAFAEAIQKGASFARAVRKVPRLSADELRDLADQAAAATEGADLIVNGILCRVGMDEVNGPPWASVAFWPIHPTTRWPAMFAPKVRLGPIYNRFTHTLSGLLDYAMFRPFHKAMRSPKPRLGAPYGDLGREVPMLLPVTRALWPGPGDWPAQTHITGFWFLERNWTPPAALVDFVEGGDPPVVLSFGSVWPVHRPGETMERVLNVIRSHGKRLVVVGGAPADVPDDVFQINDVHYPWLLPRSAAIIHHGGCNTTGEALRAGIPQITIPAFGDCPFWAGQVHDLGVAAKPVPYRKFTVERLDESLKVVLNDDAMRRRAAEVSALVRAEDGLGDAVRILEDWVARPPRRTRSLS